MNSLLCPASRAIRLGSQRILQSIPACRCAALGGSTLSLRRCFHPSGKRLAEPSPKPEGLAIAESGFWKEYKDTFKPPRSNLAWSLQSFDEGKPRITTAAGYLTSVTTLSDSLVFGRISGVLAGSNDATLQIICRDPELCAQLKGIRLNSPVNVTGTLGIKHVKKKDQDGAAPSSGSRLLHEVELRASAIYCLNTVADPHLSAEHTYSPSSRHLQIRFDADLRNRLEFRSAIAACIRQKCLHKFQEVETPILFKSTPEGAREFLVPTRKGGYAYALPQSPQQYKQILMASGIRNYFQFAKCFRDEDLRADRQPEFTQIDMEMAFASGHTVMAVVERLIKTVHNFCLQKSPDGVSIVTTALPNVPFFRMQYNHAMSSHGSDKPDLRINGLIHDIGPVVPVHLRGMLTSISDPMIEAFKLRLNARPKDVQKFIRKFMDSPEAESFRTNVDGAPGICVFDSTHPIEGLQIFGFEGAENLKNIWQQHRKYEYEDEAAFQSSQKFEDGDLVIIQARENLPLSGGSTSLGRLRIAIYKAAIAEKLIEPDPSLRFLWVVDFPMFTPDNASDPGQGGTAGFSATHHPFTAPKSADDVDLLLTDPLKAKADHYDLVVNGVELGGGSRRIHNAEMQRFIMREILKMSLERMNDFSHLFSALESGCPPHAGFAIGFDRLIAVLTGRESVKDVIAFPKSSKGEDMMVKSPSEITDMELARYHLAIAHDVQKDAARDVVLEATVSDTFLEDATIEVPAAQESFVGEPNAEDAVVEKVIAEDTITGETIVEKRPVAEENSEGDNAVNILFPKH
ncbi:tRNA synthetases class II-domain-containing protein [Rhexocercosporidium sp. MPI-PUGE-AT-0058]|nr:tRNA synthetases class II-domain-containing protein [Rhexocercosporidium sp. MPI-PUGE-AT-0058]